MGPADTDENNDKLSFFKHFAGSALMVVGEILDFLGVVRKFSE